MCGRHQGDRSEEDLLIVSFRSLRYFAGKSAKRPCGFFLLITMIWIESIQNHERDRLLEFRAGCGICIPLSHIFLGIICPKNALAKCRNIVIVPDRTDMQAPMPLDWALWKRFFA